MTRRLGSPPHASSARLGAVALLFLLLTLAASSCAQERVERPIGPGVRLFQWTQPAGPNALYAVEVDTSDPFIGVGVSLGQGETLGLEPLSHQADRLTRPDRYPIAGVNGDYFYYPAKRQPGIPTSAAVLDGELIRTPFPRSALVISPDAPPSIRILKARSRVTLPDGSERALDTVNQARGADQLVLFTPRYGATTRTDATGTEVYLRPEVFPLQHGVTHLTRVLAVQQSAGDGAIQPGCWVLSGSGSAGMLLKSLKPDDTVSIRVDFDPALGPKDQVLGGGPRIVRDGKVSIEAEGGSQGDAFARTRYPRTAVGFNGRKLYLLAVDGRQNGYSVGMSLFELAKVMVDLGCTDAMNLDGGGSTTLWVRGSVQNRPSDGRERAISNGLLVFSTAPKGDPARLAPTPLEINALAGAEVALGAVGEDQYYNPVSLDPAKAEWSVDPLLGTIRDGRFVAAPAPDVPAGQEFIGGSLVIASGPARGSVPVRIYSRPSRVEIVPGTVRLGTQTQQTFLVRAYNVQGKLLALPPGIEWSATPEIGQVLPAGTLATGATAAAGMVTASVGGVTASARVEVAETIARALDDFEGPGAWTLRVTPPGTPGRAAVMEGTARSGRRALRLEYDFSTGSGTRAVYAVGERALGKPFALKLWAYGDGQGAWLRARVKDAKGELHTLDLARKVDWAGTWRELRAPLSDDLPTPITLESIYVVEPDAAAHPKGAILIDDLSVDQ